MAPDLLSGYGPDGGDTTSFASLDEVMQATLKLSEKPEEILAKLKAGRDYGLTRPGTNGKSASVGFCDGGKLSWEFATIEPRLNAAVVYYGQPAGQWEPPPVGTFVPSDALARIEAPVLGLYGGETEDLNVAITIPSTVSKMKELGKAYEPHIYVGASHAFLRNQSGQSGANRKASQQAWALMIAWLRKHTMSAARQGGGSCAGFPTDTERDSHRDGWTTALGKLEAVVSGETRRNDAS